VLLDPAADATLTEVMDLAGLRSRTDAAHYLIEVCSTLLRHRAQGGTVTLTGAGTEVPLPLDPPAHGLATYTPYTRRREAS
jgi:hypothetical protein